MQKLDTVLLTYTRTRTMLAIKQQMLADNDVTAMYNRRDPGQRSLSDSQAHVHTVKARLAGRLQRRESDAFLPSANK